MSNWLKILRFIALLAAAAMIGLWLKGVLERNAAGNTPPPPACVVSDTGGRDCPLQTHNPN